MTSRIMRSTTALVCLFSLAAGCASEPSSEGWMGPPYTVPAEEATGQAAETFGGQECIYVFCGLDSNAAYDPRYCCMDGGQGGEGD